MDQTEMFAKQYLDTLGFDSLIYEPDGNIPPDFLANNKIAIEVTRLNQHHNHKGNYRGLEETGIPLWDSLEKILNEFDKYYKGKSYFVFLQYRRPIQKLKKLRPKFREALMRFIEDPDVGIREFNVTDSITIKVMESSLPDENTFIMGGSSDLNSGGFVISEVERNFKICIDKKTEIVKHHQKKYPEWWLILSDTIGYGLNEHNREQFNEIFNIQHKWDKVILINPINPVNAFII